jgi:hypothetical protein
MNATLPDTDFRVYARLLAFEKADAGDGSSKMGIGGIVSTDGLDRQQERVLADGLDFANFLAYGWFNDNHGQSQGDIMGYPTGVRRVKPGDILPTGETCKVNGWWAEGYLLDNKKGRECWENVEALKGTPRGLGFSIEGKVRNRKPGGIVAHADVSNVAITHVPVNPQTGLVALAKALTAGSAVASGDIGTGPGDGGALRGESLEGAPPKGKTPRVFPPVDFFAATELDDEGQPVRKSVDHAPGLPVVTDQHHVESWADALQYGREHMGTPDDVTLSKSEARIVARADLHHLRGPVVDRLLAGATR